MGSNLIDTRLLLRVEDAAERIEVSRAKMFQLLAEGRIRSVKIGAARRIPVAALQEFVDSLSTDAA